MKVLNVRLTDERHAALRARAEASGTSVSSLVNDWIDASATGEHVPEPSGERVGAEEVSPVPEPPKPAFLSAPVDDCAACSHDRQESDHLGGRPCKFKIGRHNCGCTFEGF